MASPAEDVTLALIATNYSGGKRHRVAPGERRHLEQLVEVVRDLGSIDALLCLQEMATQQHGLPLAVPELEAALGSSAQSTFVPRVSTAWYPLTAKWGDVVGDEATRNEGPCVLSTGAEVRLLPWSALEGPKDASSLVRVLDLPALEFRRGEGGAADDLGWVTTNFAKSTAIGEAVTFRPTYYGGTRDSDPRAAQACVIGSNGFGQPDAVVPQLVVVNVHLSTLRSEYVTGERRRVEDAGASFQRNMQLGLIARFVHELQSRHSIPIVVAGDFNAEPDSTEMRNFRDATGLEPIFAADVCWRCGRTQVPRPRLPFYHSRYGEGGLSLKPEGSEAIVLETDAICSNESCLEPRFTHKGNLMMLDNILVDPSLAHSAVLEPRVDVARAYSDHAVLSCQLLLRNP